MGGTNISIYINERISRGLRKMKGKGVFNVLLLLIVSLVATSLVAAVPVTIDEVKVDGDEIDPSGANSVRVLDRDNELVVKVKVSATADVENAQIEAALRGYDHDDLIEDISDVFDMKAGRTYVKTLKVNLPDRLDKDQYKLRIRVDDRDGDTTQESYDLEIENERHDLTIKDVLFSPTNEVMSGRALLTTVRIKNLGMVDEDEGVKVSVSIPALGISAADYVDEVEEDESTTSEELYLRVPKCSPAGVYDAVVAVEYDDGDEVEKLTKQIRVVEDENCDAMQDEKPKTIITVGPTSQDVAMGEGGVIYPLTITNAGSVAKTYVVNVDGYQDWAEVRVSPANIVVLQGGEAKALYVYVSAKEEAAEGEHMFSVAVQSGTETLKQFALKANVTEGEDAGKGMDVKNVLLIGLLVLVVLLVILGLIIGFGKLKGDDSDFDDEDESGETYY